MRLNIIRSQGGGGSPGRLKVSDCQLLRAPRSNHLADVRDEHMRNLDAFLKESQAISKMETLRNGEGGKQETARR